MPIQPLVFFLCTTITYIHTPLLLLAILPWNNSSNFCLQYTPILFDKCQHIHIHTYTYTYIHTHTYIHIHTYTYIHTHTYIHIHIHTYTYIHTHTYIHIHIHTYTYTYTYTYIHTHTHTYTNNRRQNGQEGFVPANYVKEAEPLKTTKTVKRKEMVSVPVKVSSSLSVYLFV